MANEETLASIVNNFLNEVGLGSLAQPLLDYAIGVGQDGLDESTMQNWMEQQPAFDERFPAFKKMRSEGKPVSVSDILTYETQALQVMNRWGGVLNRFEGQDGRKAMQELMASNVAIPELTQRLQDGYARVASAPASVRNAFRNQFGAQGDAALAAMFVDPTQATDTLLEMANTADLMGSASDLGFNLTAGVAARAWDQHVQTDTQVDEALNEAARLRALSTTQVDEEGLDGMGSNEANLLGAVTGNANDASQVEALRSKRAAVTAGSSGVGITDKGSTLGTAE